MAGWKPAPQVRPATALLHPITGPSSHPSHRGYLATSALSPDGKKLATGGLDGIVRVWDADTGEFLRALVGHNSYVYGLAWSPDGTVLASAGSFDGTARLWDAATGMPLRVL